MSATKKHRATGAIESIADVIADYAFEKEKYWPDLDIYTITDIIRHYSIFDYRFITPEDYVDIDTSVRYVVEGAQQSLENCIFPDLAATKRNHAEWQQRLAAKHRKCLRPVISSFLLG